MPRHHPSSLWPDTAIPTGIAGHGRGRSRPSDSARCRPVQLVASVWTSRVLTDPVAEAEGLEPPWTRFWRPPLSPLSYTSSANLQIKKPPRSVPGGLPIWGLSSVVSRHRQAHLAAREGTEHRAAQPILAAVFGERWIVHHDHHGAELLRASLREVNLNQRKQ